MEGGHEGSSAKMTKTDLDSQKFHVLILGASYGSLLATKLLLAGHDVTLVCRESTAEIFNKEGSIVRIPIRGRDEPVNVRSLDLPGKLCASSPDKVLAPKDDEAKSDKETFDLVVLAMQEPQYSSPGVRELVERIASSRLPTMAITNMPLLPYLRRIPGLKDGVSSSHEIRSCFADPSLWDAFDNPELVTQCSPDPQAFRPPDEDPNVLVVRLPTNFKAARFGSERHTAILRRLEGDIQAARYDGHEIPVKLRLHDSVFVPLAKWAMLLAGNYRCVAQYPEDMVPIRDAVRKDLEASRSVYEWVVSLCTSLGGDEGDFVPFEKYAKAAESLANPSSAARALKGGARSIERVDKLVRAIALQKGMETEVVDGIVVRVDEWILHNSE